MKSLILAVALLVPGAVAAQPYVANPEQAVAVSSIPVTVVNIATHTPTRVDISGLAGRFAIEIQNIDTASDACCAFTASFSTTTANTGTGCRRVSKNLGTWVVSAWYRDLPVYCQSFSTTAATPIVATQAK